LCAFFHRVNNTLFNSAYLCTDSFSSRYYFFTFIWQSFLQQTRSLTPKLLQLSIIGLGAGMNLAVIGHESIHGILYTLIVLS